MKGKVDKLESEDAESDREGRRKRLFDLYSSNLHMLVSSGLINIELEYEKSYLCPLCLKQFNEEALSQQASNPLTLEDVPPISLGGHANILTCKRCNNLCGQKIDHHLTKRMEGLTNSLFLPNSSFAAVFSNKIIGKINGIVNIDENRRMTMVHDGAHNAPGKVDTFASTVMKDDANRHVNVEQKDLRIEAHKVAIALLKISYLRMFEEYGYAFILFEPYRRVRTQILESDIMIYPLEGWIISGDDVTLSTEGVFYMPDPGLECFIISFHLKVKGYKHHIRTLLPLKYPISYIRKELDLVPRTPLLPREIKRYLGFDLPEQSFSVTGEKLLYEKRFLTDYEKTLRMINRVNTGTYNA